MLMEDVAFNMNRPTMADFPIYALPAGYQFRTYQPGDDRTWTAIHLASEPFIKFDDSMFERQFGTQLDALPDRMYFVETDAGRAIASITAWWDANWRDTGDWGRIHWVVVHPDYQRRGLTKPMMTHAMRRLAQSHTRATLGTSSGRPWAVKVYLDFGFAPDPAELADPKIYQAWQAVQAVIQHPSLQPLLRTSD